MIARFRVVIALSDSGHASKARGRLGAYVRNDFRHSAEFADVMASIEALEHYLNAARTDGVGGLAVMSVTGEERSNG